MLFDHGMPRRVLRKMLSMSRRTDEESLDGVKEAI
jgi:hypothetical protein